MTAWLLALLVAAGGGELVRNGGFEADADGDGVPDGWSWSWQQTQSSDTPELGAAKQQPEVTWDAPRPGGGQRALTVTVARPQDDGVWTQDNLPAVPGCKVYRLSAWVKVAAADGGVAQVGPVYLGAGGKWLGAGYDAIRVASPGEWQRFTAYVAAPAETELIRLRVWTNMRRSGTITVSYDDISLEATDLTGPPPLIHLDPRPLPALDEAAKARGFVAWASPMTQLIFPATKPSTEDLQRPLRALCVAGGEDVAAVAVHALAAGELRAEVSALAGPGGAVLPSTAVTVRPARNLALKLWARDSRVLLSPRYLLPHGTPLNLESGTSGWLWLNISTSADAPAGTYRGTLTITSQGGRQDLALTAEVFRVQLDPPTGYTLGFYDSAKVYDGDTLTDKWRRQRAHGMTSVGYFGNFGGELKRENGRVVADVAGSELAEAVDAYREAGFPEPLCWLMGGDIERFCLQAGPLESEAFGSDYVAVMRAILAHGRDHGWPELIVQPVDEAFEHRPRFAAMVRCLELLRGIDGLRLEADGMNGNPADLESTMPLIDVYAEHDGPFYRRGVYDPERWKTFAEAVAAQHGEIWFYNVDISGWRPEMGRFAFGWHLLKSGVKGCLMWQYQSVVKDPYGDPGTGYAFLHEFPAAGDEPGGPSPSLEAMREGIEDLRLYLTFRRLAAQATGQAAARAEQVQAEIDRRLARIDYATWQSGPTQGVFAGEGTTDDGQPYLAGDLKAPTGWSHDDYDRVRELLLRAVAELQSAG